MNISREKQIFQKDKTFYENTHRCQNWSRYDGVNMKPGPMEAYTNADCFSYPLLKTFIEIQIQTQVFSF